MTFAIARTQGEGTYTIDTSDLVYAAHSLHPQLKELQAAGEGVKTPTLEQAFEGMVLDSLNKVQTWDGHTEEWYKLQIAGIEAGN